MSFGWSIRHCTKAPIAGRGRDEVPGDEKYEESRAYWDSVRRGAQEYDKLPAWQNGALRSEIERPESAKSAVEGKEEARKLGSE